MNVLDVVGAEVAPLVSFLGGSCGSRLGGSSVTVGLFFPFDPVGRP